MIFQNSPAWNLHPLMCENVLIEEVQVRNPSYAQNGDGLDLESCKNALIVNSTFDVGDDGICLKSGKDEDGRRRGRVCENVVVDGCTVFKGHGGFVVGSEMSGGLLSRPEVVVPCGLPGVDGFGFDGLGFVGLDGSDDAFFVWTVTASLAADAIVLTPSLQWKKNTICF